MGKKPKTSTVTPVIAKTLKSMRRQQGWSQDRLATTSGLTQAAISNYENGITSPGLDSLVALATAYDVPVASMLGDVDAALAQARTALGPQKKEK